MGCLLIGSVMPMWVLFSLFMNVPINQKKKKKKKQVFDLVLLFFEIFLTSLVPNNAKRVYK